MSTVSSHQNLQSFSMIYLSSEWPGFGSIFMAVQSSFAAPTSLPNPQLTSNTRMTIWMPLPISTPSVRTLPNLQRVVRSL